MGIFDKIGDAAAGFAGAVEWNMFLVGDAIDRKISKKDIYHYLKKNKEYVDDDVNQIEKEFAENSSLVLARFYCIAYIAAGALDGYLYGDWKFGEEDFLTTLSDDIAIKNKLKKLLTHFYWGENAITRNSEPAIFEKPKKYIDLITEESDYDIILADIKRLYPDADSRGAVTISRVRTYINKKKSELNGDDEGNESLAKSLDDLI